MDLDILSTLGTSNGLALVSGINPYLPLLIVAGQMDLRQHTHPSLWDAVVVVMLILVLADFFADKIPGVSAVWNSVHTFIRPIAGAVVAGLYTAGSGHPEQVPVAVVMGLTLATTSTATKSATRFTLSSATAGFAGPFVSIAEDIATIVGVIASYLLAPLMFVLSIIFLLVVAIISPFLFSALRYRWLIVSSYLRARRGDAIDGPATNFSSRLTEREQSLLKQSLPDGMAPRAGVRTLWTRKLNGRGPWGRRRVALTTWLIVIDGALLILPVTRPSLMQIVPFADIQSIKLRQGWMSGVLTISHSGKKYNFTILRTSRLAALDLANMLQQRYHLPASPVATANSLF
jgi:hypothetical protein